MKKKVLIIQEYFPVYRKPFFDLLAKKYDLTLIVSDSNFGSINAEEDVSYVKKIGKLKSYLKGNFFWLENLTNVDFNQYHIIVLGAAPRNLSFLYLMFYLKMRGKKTIFWGQFWSATSSKFGFMLRMLLLQLSSAIMFYTEKECVDYKKTFLGRNDIRPLMGLNNGLDVEVISRYKLRYDINRGTNILFIGRLTDKSNLLQLLAAINISKYRDDLKLHIIGDGEILNNCNEWVVENKLERNIIFHGALTKEEDIARVVNKCLIFVYPGDVGLSLIHAMAYGLPCIIHDNFLQHGPEIAALLESKGGIFFQKNNVDNLKNNLDIYLDNKELLVNHSYSNFKIVEKKFNHIEMSNAFDRLFEMMELKGSSDT